MTNRLPADVEKESASTVTVARRVFEELAAAGDRGLQPQSPPTDDVMVWIRQVIDQDVNLFDGSELLADEPARSVRLGPAADADARQRSTGALRSSGCRRMVAEDRLGTFVYLVAAAPVPARGRMPS